MGPTPSPQPTSSQPHQGIIYLTGTASPTATPSSAPAHKDVLNTPAGIFLGIAALVVTVLLIIEGVKQKAFGDNDNNHKPQGWRR